MKASSFKYLIIGLFLLNLGLKVFKINSIPSYLTHDEIFYAAQAQSIMVDGQDIMGNGWHPWQLKPSNPIYSELTGTTLIPGFILFPNDPIKAIKALPIIMGSIIPLLLGLISYYLSKNRLICIATILIATFNPWLFQFSRMGFDSLYGLFFYLLGIVIVLWASRWWRLVSLAPFFWGFFQYQGFKPLLLPIVCITCGYVLVKSGTKVFQSFRSSQLWALLLIPVFIILLLITYLVRLPTQSAAIRLNEITLLSNEANRAQVNTLRRLTFDNPISYLVDNKFTLVLNTLIIKALTSLNLPWFFAQGNQAIDTFAVTQTGFFHLIDLILIVCGFYSLWSQKKLRLESWYLTLFFGLGFIPHMLKNDQLWLTFRGAFQIVTLIIVASFGVDFLTTFRSKLLKLFMIGFYSISILIFFYHYFFQYPLTSTANNAFYYRLVAEYTRRQSEKLFAVVVENPVEFLDHFLTYNQLINSTNLQEIRPQIGRASISFGNIMITSMCDPINFADRTVIITASIEQCALKTTTPVIFVSSPIDSGSRFKIYGDEYCQQQPLNHFLNLRNNRFNLSKLTQALFCQSFFTNHLIPNSL